MNHQKFDIAVLGGGPGGYPAAIKASQLGRSVALIEMNELGGTCLNRGCIPSKALIACAEVLDKIKDASEFGISVKGVSYDYRKMVERKDQIVDNLRNGLAGVIAANKITLFRGFGKLLSPHEIKVQGDDNALIYADKIIIATGSEPKNIPSFPFDYEKIHDSTSLLDMTTLPKKVAIIGGGIVGCEFASLFAAFGIEVTIFEMLSRIIPMESTGVSTALAKAFRKKGIGIRTSVLVDGVKRNRKGVTVHLAGGETEEADIALISIGRTLNTSNIGLDKAGVLVAENGMIKVNNRMETNIKGIYAVGDIASRWWLAHVASHQGIIAASNACGKEAHMHYNAVPNVIFTSPEIGTVGYSLEQAIEEGYKATLGAFPFQALGKSQATFQIEGFAQVVIDRETGQILGAQVVGHEASSLIAEMAVAIANELTVESIKETIHAHPTIAEAWMEAAFVADETPLHLPPVKSRAKAAIP
jgi:dihydrolipoamide dehydrogenase